MSKSWLIRSEMWVKMFCRRTQMVILFCARFYGQSFDIPLNQLEKSEIYLCCQKVALYLTSLFRLLHEFWIILVHVTKTIGRPFLDFTSVHWFNNVLLPFWQVREMIKGMGTRQAWFKLTKLKFKTLTWKHCFVFTFSKTDGHQAGQEGDRPVRHILIWSNCSWSGVWPFLGSN